VRVCVVIETAVFHRIGETGSPDAQSFLHARYEPEI
jgi:hypothetical protein